jgi:hypothetical protein
LTCRGRGRHIFYSSIRLYKCQLEYMCAEAEPPILGSR